MEPKSHLFLYHDSLSLLVINPKGKIKKLFIPFRVKCIKSIDKIQVSTWVCVDSLSFSKQSPLLYMINGAWYRYDHFTIVINF